MEDATPRDGESETGPRGYGRYVPMAAVLAALAIAWATGYFDQISLSNLIRHREWLRDQVADHRVVALLAYMGLYCALVAVSFPGASLLTVIAGFLFGGLTAGLATIFAATAGATVIFLIARTSFGEALARRAGPFARRMMEGFNRDSFIYLLTLRLAPVFPFWVVNIVPALFNMRLMPYVTATFVGIIPGTFAYSYVGAGLDSVIAAQEAANPGCGAAGNCSIDPASLITPEILAGMAGLALISILALVMKRYRAARGG